MGGGRGVNPEAGSGGVGGVLRHSPLRMNIPRQSKSGGCGGGDGWYVNGMRLKTILFWPGLMVLIAGLRLGAQPAPDLLAAQGGDAQAQYDVAGAYFQGIAGMERDIPKAMEWLEKAAAQGHMEANYRRGEIYFHGYGGIEKDLTKAAAAFRRPAVADFEEAKVYLGFLYFTGQGVTQDADRGIALLREAASRGQPAAWKLLWEAYVAGKLSPLHEDELNGMIEAGVEAGDVRAKESFGLRLMLGQGVERDPERARPLLLEMAELGSINSAAAMAQDIGERIEGPGNEQLSARERRDLEAQFKRMVHLIAVFGGPQGRDAFIRTLTRLTPLAVHAPREADGSMVVNDDLVAALAWGRIHRSDPDQEPDVLRWLREGEAWIADYQRIRDRVDARERIFRSELERINPTPTQG